jgi:hypothetical protein
MFSGNLAYGMVDILKAIPQSCAGCNMGKATFHYPKGGNKLSTSQYKVGEMCHFDLTGPYRVGGLNNEKYMLTIVDNRSTHSTVYFLESKSGAATLIMEYVAFSTRITGNKMKRMRMDNG